MYIYERIRHEQEGGNPDNLPIVLFPFFVTCCLYWPAAGLSCLVIRGVDVLCCWLVSGGLLTRVLLPAARAQYWAGRRGQHSRQLHRHIQQGSEHGDKQAERFIVPSNHFQKNQ